MDTKVIIIATYNLDEYNFSYPYLNVKGKQSKNVQQEKEIEKTMIIKTWITASMRRLSSSRHKFVPNFQLCLVLPSLIHAEYSAFSKTRRLYCVSRLGYP